MMSVSEEACSRICWMPLHRRGSECLELRGNKSTGTTPKRGNEPGEHHLPVGVKIAVSTVVDDLESIAPVLALGKVPDDPREPPPRVLGPVRRGDGLDLKRIMVVVLQHVAQLLRGGSRAGVGIVLPVEQESRDGRVAAAGAVQENPRRRGLELRVSQTLDSGQGCRQGRLVRARPGWQRRPDAGVMDLGPAGLLGWGLVEVHGLRIKG